jgi:hypothetical protein
VIELRFHQELYDGFAVDEAVKAYADFMSAELAREEQGYVVRVTASPGAVEQAIDEEVLAAELANYALGKTIERSRTAGDAAGAAAPDRDAPGAAGEEGAR